MSAFSTASRIALTGYSVLSHRLPVSESMIVAVFMLRMQNAIASENMLAIVPSIRLLSRKRAPLSAVSPISVPGTTMPVIPSSAETLRINAEIQQTSDSRYTVSVIDSISIACTSFICANCGRDIRRSVRKAFSRSLSRNLSLHAR